MPYGSGPGAATMMTTTSTTSATSGLSAPNGLSSKRRLQTRFLAPIIIIAVLLFLPMTVPSSPRGEHRVPGEANIAYFIQVTPATLAHLPRLFRRGFHPHNFHLLHYDVKIPASDVRASLSRLRRSVPTFENTYVAPSQPLVYDGVSMVLNTLSAMSFLLQIPGWDFFINLSGSDYPLTKPGLPRRLLAAALPYNAVFLSPANRSKWESSFEQRAARIHFDGMLAQNNDNLTLHEVLTRNPNMDNFRFVPMYTEAWLIASRDFTQQAVSSADSRQLLLAMANMRGSDEFFFGSLAFNNAKLNRSIVPNVFRTVVWVHDGQPAGQHPYYVDERVDGDWLFLPNLVTSPHFHARKFKHADTELMDILDERADDAERIKRVSRLFRAFISRLKVQYEKGSREIDRQQGGRDDGRHQPVG